MRERIAHAVLIHGQSGVGKRLLGRSLARALLCESPDRTLQERGGCGACAACGWFDQGNHPDFRQVVSEAVAAAEGLEIADDDSDAVGEPGAESAGPRSKKAPSREIKIEQIRALHGFLAIATHRARSRVVLMYPLETVKDVAANALLKMLEEPPPRTVFILVADHLGRIPATVVSRCQKVFVSRPPPAIATAWLEGQGIEDAGSLLAISGGAPLTALALAQDADAMALHRQLLQFLEKPGLDAALATAEGFGKAAAAPLVRWMQQWVADCVAMRLAGRLRYHPAQSTLIARLAGAARIDALMGLAQRLDAVRRTVDHPLNNRLLFESLLIAYADAMVPAQA